ncbi:hypothetical protein BAZSYMA_ACONTIG01759_1 [Bathymodiolus azoricus thioautotrophic gill symbiont]|uniref:Uncharacterized protein n=1 Tax=Bathymodiolus azoricus thioautotrophic gill symbiont TaxID=235205 RepID=A0A1H6LHS5_9GAMM|nr:hypothetical protein BAZSYMA_ACONTIG01759_1 [Bathymodiolus azoricus thioautotrophic gill symbiont]
MLLSLSTFEPEGCFMRIHLGFLSGVRSESGLILKRDTFDSPFKALISTSCDMIH